MYYNFFSYLSIQAFYIYELWRDGAFLCVVWEIPVCGCCVYDLPGRPPTTSVTTRKDQLCSPTVCYAWTLQLVSFVEAVLLFFVSVLHCFPLHSLWLVHDVWDWPWQSWHWLSAAGWGWPVHSCTSGTTKVWWQTCQEKEISASRHDHSISIFSIWTYWTFSQNFIVWYSSDGVFI